MRPPTIAIFCRELKPGGDPFSNDYYWQAYQDLLFALKDRGINAYLVTDNNTYRGHGLFKHAYTLDVKGTLDDLQLITNVEVDLVFDRGGFIGHSVAVLNPPILTKIAMSKLEMYEYFTDLQPRSFISRTKKQIHTAARKLPGSKIVVKEPEGSGGKEVYIGDKQKVLAELPAKYPVLVQEFLDTSTGVPGQVAGVHDVRLALCGGEIISYYVRTAKEGELRANVAQGGKLVYFDVKDAPAELVEIVQAIDGLFAGQPRYYALDFMHTPKGWKLVELNSYLGLMPLSEGAQAEKTLHKLADYLVLECRKAKESLSA